MTSFSRRTSTKVSAGIIACAALVIVTTGVVIWCVGDSSNGINKAAVVTNGHECADIGKSILEKGGNAVEAAIAALFCEGIAMPQSMGLGGGFLMVFYNHSVGRAWSMNAREVAPAAATEDMFHGKTTDSQRGGRAVAVPGELVGYWKLYEKYGGNVRWKDLIQPTINLCRSGIYVTEFLDGVFKIKKDLLYRDPVLREIFIDPSTNETWKEGQYVKRLKLAHTLEIIAKEGGYALNNGSLTEGFVNDIQKHGGIITVDDMNNFEPIQEEPIEVALENGNTLYTSPLPGSGIILAYILNILTGFLDKSAPNSVNVNQRIVEAFKWAYARRTELGDPTYQDFSQLIANLTSTRYAEETRSKIRDDWTSTDPAFYGANVSVVEDHGTANICVIDADGNAVTVTSTINFLFGAGFASESTGIIMNDEMDDFSMPGKSNGFDLPPSPSNYIEGGKRPMSSMCPSVIVNSKKEVVMVVGGAGGTKITTGVALTIMRHLWFDMNLKNAVDEKRVHHQLFPMNIVFDPDYATEAPKVIEGLVKIGHNYTLGDENGFAAVTAISKFKPNLKGASEKVTAAFDKRRKGSISYI